MNISQKTVKFNATYDYVFKEVFKDSKLCVSLINAILNTDYKSEDITYISESINGLFIDSKTSNFDIAIMVGDHTKLVIEMQKNPPSYDMKQRLLYYVLQLYYSDYKKGQIYDSKDNIVICLTDYNILERDKWIDIYTFKNSDNDEIVGIKIVILDFKKIKYCDNIEVKGWVDMITRTDFSEFEGVTEQITAAAEKVVELNENQKEYLRILSNLEEYDKRQKMIRESEIEKKGRIEGIIQAKKEFIKNMYLAGISVKQIADISKVSVEEVYDIIK